MGWRLPTLSPAQRGARTEPGGSRLNTVEEYFDYVRQLVQSLPDVQTERYEEHILSPTRGNLRIRLRFSDNTLLEISEAFVFVGGELRRLSYRAAEIGVVAERKDDRPLVRLDPGCLDKAPLKQPATVGT